MKEGARTGSAARREKCQDFCRRYGVAPGGAGPGGSAKCSQTAAVITAAAAVLKTATSGFVSAFAKPVAV